MTSGVPGSDDDPAEVLSADPVLAPLIERYGRLELTPAADPFARLVTSIVNQQLSTASARAIRGRLFDRFEVAPRALLDADPEALRATGLSSRKVDYLRSTAETFLRDGLTRASFEAMSAGDVIHELTSIHGVGVWTAKMFLIFVLGRADVFPVEDLAIRNGITRLYGELSKGEMIEVAERWRPYRSIASLYVWRDYEAGPVS